MQIEYCEQRSTEWLSLRMGIPTGGSFDRIFKLDGTLKDSAPRRTYAIELAAERFTRVLQDHFVGSAAEHGIHLEPRAADWYYMQTDIEMERVGFVYPDGHKQWGCSPDRLGTERGLECKCPLRTQMVRCLLSGDKPPSCYMLQVQAALWITGLPEWDLVAYTEDRGMPSRIWTVEPDKELHKAFEKELPKFCKQVEKITEKLREVAG